MRKILRELNRIWSRINSSDPYNGVMRIVARISIGVACWLVGRVDPRYRWLAHYLLGNGSNLPVKGGLLAEAVYNCTAFWVLAGRSIGEVFLVKTDGRAYWAKLHQVVGTFSATVIEKNRLWWVTAIDRYDWHPISGGSWDGIPAPLSKRFGNAVGRIANALWPALKEHLVFYPTGELFIRDSLWPFLGGKEFNTTIEFPAPQMSWWIEYWTANGFPIEPAGELDTALPNDS